MNSIVHELRNQLAVAVANVEAFIDGKLEPIPRRLRSVSDALTGIDGLLVELAEHRLAALPDEEQILEICTIISNEVVAIAAASARERVKLAIHRVSVTNGASAAPGQNEPHRVGQIVNDLLLNAIRHTPPGGAIVVDCHRENESFEFSVSNEAPELHLAHGTAHGGTITIVSRPGDGATFTVRLLDGAPLALTKPAGANVSP